MDRGPRVMATAPDWLRAHLERRLKELAAEVEQAGGHAGQAAVAAVPLLGAGGGAGGIVFRCVGEDTLVETHSRNLLSSIAKT